MPTAGARLRHGQGIAHALTAADPPRSIPPSVPAHAVSRGYSKHPRSTRASSSNTSLALRDGLHLHRCANPSELSLIRASAPTHVLPILVGFKRAEDAQALAEQAGLGLDDLLELEARGRAAQQVSLRGDGSRRWQVGKGEKSRLIKEIQDALPLARDQLGVRFAVRSRVPHLSKSTWSCGAPDDAADGGICIECRLRWRYPIKLCQVTYIVFI